MGGEEKPIVLWLFFLTGLPPRGRGRDNLYLETFYFFGITPAWAGKRSIPPDGKQPYHNYPRVGGEEVHLRNGRRGQEGLPPRGRGRDITTNDTKRRERITPAWAGKSNCVGQNTRCSTDYPRVGGEEVEAVTVEVAAEGLPPRGRGRARASVWLGAPRGITPAWAGKRRSPAAGPWVRADYPRVGGEEAPRPKAARWKAGLPPRGRGRGARGGLGALDHGITPAWAGKRASAIHSSTRSCGLPPRGRGRGFGVLAHGANEGITPAWAGKRYSLRK